MPPVHSIRSAQTVITDRRGGYTAIELLLAVSLSAIIILLAASALRMTTRAISLVNRLSTENNLLLTGFLVSVDDGDFWHSQADPAFPWAKKGQSLADIDINGAVTTNASAAENANNKRLFRPVAFTAGSIEDPNWILPHDPRGWYRNHLGPNPRPIYTDGRNASDSVCGNAPVGFSPRAVFGDYAGLSNLGMPATSLEGARPALTMALFKRLGFSGVCDYLPRGALSLILRPDRSRVEGMVTDQSLNYDQGEIPWALATGNRQRGFGDKWFMLRNPAYGGAADYATPIKDVERTNYLEALSAMGGSGFWATDLDWWTLTGNRLVFASQYEPLISGGWDDFRMNDGIRRPLRGGPGHGLNVAGVNDKDQVGASYMAAGHYGNTTMLVPAMVTGETNRDLTTESGSQPTLTLTSFRAHEGCGTKFRSRVQVFNPTTGQTLAIEFGIAATTFRGARQYWAAARAPRNADQTISAQPDMGDYYAP